MISRRGALKFGVAGIAVSVFGTNQNVSGPRLARAVGHDMPTFRMQAPERPGLSLDKPIAIKWRHQAEDWILSVYVAQGLAIFRDLGQSLYALDVNTGEERWRYVSDDQLSSWVSIDDSRVYVGTQYGGLQTVDIVTGQKRWEFPTNGAVNSRPMLDNGTVFFGSRDGYFYALDTATGAEQWRFSASSGFSTLPRIADSIVYVQSDSYTTYAIDAGSGQELWQYNFGSSTGYAQAVEGTFFITVFEPSHTLVALDSANGHERWRFPTGQTAAPAPFVSEGVVYFGFGEAEMSFTCAVDVATGEELWRFAHPAKAGETAREMHVAGAHNGAVYTRVWDENFIALDQVTGRELWRFVAGDAFTNALISDGIAWLGNSDHYLYAIDLSTGEEIFSVQLDHTVADQDLEGGTLFITSYNSMVHALQNVEPAILRTDATLRGGPSQTAVERGTVNAGEEITTMGARESAGGDEWAEVTIAGMTGWIPVDAIDPATMPPEGEIEYVYVPE